MIFNMLGGLIAWVLIFFVIIIVPIGIVVLIIISRRKSNQSNAAAVPVQPAQVQAPKPEEKPEEPKPETKPVEKEKEPEEPPASKAELKEAKPTETKTITQKPKKDGKKKTGLIIVIVVLLLLILLGVGGFYLYRKIANVFKGSINTSQSNESVEEGEYKASLKPIKAQTDTDKARSVTKTVSSAGAVLQTQGADGTLYTLNVPVDAIILPSEVTMTPLTNVPVSGYKDKVVGGVVLTGGFDFIRPTYLSIQPNRTKPEKKPAFSYCVVGSRGFDPEVCAGAAGIPFTSGVAPGKIVAFASQSGKEDAQAFLEPTIYTGIKDTYTAQVLYPGAYFADNANKADVEKFAQTTFALGADFTNKTEVLMHLVALGGKIDPYKAEIKRFERQKTDYPREVLKSAILARAIGNKEIATKRIDDYYNTISKRSKNIRSSFVPVIRYAGVIRQVNSSAAKKHRFAQSGKSNIAYAAEPVKLALDDFVPTGNGGDENYDSPLPNFEGDNGVDYGDGQPPRTWQDIWNELAPPGTTPPELQDWLDAVADAAAQKKADDELEKNCRDEINSKNTTACEKAQAIRTVVALGRMKGSDYNSFSGIINSCAKECATMEECENMGDLGDKWGNSTISNNAANSIQEFLLKNSQECDLAHKKGLADFGNNTCGDTDNSAAEEPVPLGKPSLDL
ncbi:MAG: hypothetical protein NTZ65_03470 [Candidatus Berkelbacteria bacterium]|nr:hypothetical protein [Candidatus Berkelbacteria bacterium]